MVRFKGFKNLNIGRIVSAITTTLVALYGGGIMLSAVGDVMVNTTSNLYTGLSLIGYTVETNTQTNGTAGCFIGCGQELAADCANNSMTAAKNCITDTSGTGILAIIGIAGLMSIINQFVRF